MPVSASQRDQRVAFERATFTRDGMNAKVAGWAHYADAWVGVSFGTGAERRNAAQVGGSQAATFRADWSPTLADVTIEDRIQFMGAAWDITNVSPFGRNDGIDFTAVRAV